MLMRSQLHRRAQRLLPAGIETVALLSAASPHQWEGSPLSALPLPTAGRRGWIGMALHARTDEGVRRDGANALQQLQCASPRPPLRQYLPWQRLSNGSYWARSSDALLGVLLVVEDAAVWLLWQQPAAAACTQSWLR
ncbi:hypothetical protein [Xanthomonas campestris]|uniref:hypothetical protein n=1 Tax=Xanthomonas campestris TaxID=339 RepID=UPI0005AED0F0|nr:hypothetical protein [Xanthomonas campestris]KIQ24473.1 hypothetical protein RT95_15430 [Xanthomonas campestris]